MKDLDKSKIILEISIHKTLKKENLWLSQNDFVQQNLLLDSFKMRKF